jgi:peroxiredoxin Q/BCP
MSKTLVVAALMMVLFGSALAADLKTGDPAPGVRLKADDGTDFDLKSRKGQWTVLYFYPKADTPGCTKQACAFRDNISQIRQLGAQVYGVSADAVESVRNFKKKYNLNFTLLADPKLEAINAYGTKMSVTGMSRRWTFVIGPDLRVHAIDRDVDPVLDAEQTATKLKNLQAKFKQ